MVKEYIAVLFVIILSITAAIRQKKTIERE